MKKRFRFTVIILAVILIFAVIPGCSKSSDMTKSDSMK